MSILRETDSDIIATGVDIPAFHPTQAQPPGRSIAWLYLDDNLDRYNYDWSRIVAVYVDEPYNGEIHHETGTCGSPATDAKRALLWRMAAAARAKAPTARFWVNFRGKDIELILDGCPLNESYIDVISMDIYGVDFVPTLSEKYQAIYDRRPTEYQQLALVPGTFTGGHKQQSGSDGAARLSGYFAYAHSMNQNCNLPLGPVGRTGIYDRCPVWMVMGWLGLAQTHDDGDGVLYYPIAHPNSIQVLTAWQAAFTVPRVDPVRAQAIKALPLLLNN